MLSLLPWDPLGPRAQKNRGKKEKTLVTSLTLPEHYDISFLLFKLLADISWSSLSALITSSRFQDALNSGWETPEGKIMVDSLMVNCTLNIGPSSSIFLSLFTFQSLQIAVPCNPFSRLQGCIQ